MDEKQFRRSVNKFHKMGRVFKMLKALDQKIIKEWKKRFGAHFIENRKAYNLNDERIEKMIKAFNIN